MSICKECKDTNGRHMGYCQSASEDFKRQMFERDERNLRKRREFDLAVILAQKLINYKKQYEQTK